MKKLTGIFSLSIALLLFLVGVLYANEPDQYLGDTIIYYGTGGPKPNVIFVLENSRYVANYVGGVGIYQYDSANPYSGALAKDGIYTTNNFISYKHEFDLDEATDSCDGVSPSGLLETYGSYYGALDSNGSCITNPKKNDIQYYYLGDYVNYLKDEGVAATEWQANTTYNKNDIVIPTDNDALRYYATQEGAGTSDATEPDWPHLSDVDDLMTTVSDGSVIWQRSETFLNLIISVFNASSEIMSENLKFGSMIFSDNNQGGQIWSEVKDLTEGNNLAEFQDKAAALAGVSLSSAALNPVNVMLYDALNYYEDGGAGHGEYWCQESHVILIANGGHRADQNLISVVGGTGTSAEVATWGAQHGIKTHVVQLGAVDNVLQAAAENGGGEYHIAENLEDLDNSIKSILEGIVREVESSFAAPVVPASPENRTLSGDYIYVGFFKPQSNEPWWGNLKKFGLTVSGSQLQIVDKNGVLATNSDGTFKASATSYWSSEADGFLVDKGGVGAMLQERPLTGTNMRNIWTVYSGAKAFPSDFANADLVQALDVATEAEALALVNFVRGEDSYDEIDDSDKREWIMGDILHSRPLVVNYGDDRGSYIFVGTNGGMFHAFRDSDGEEEWAFIPPELLPRLKYLREPEYAYFVDGTPTVYSHANSHGVIQQAVVVFGLRRGGGWADSSTSGAHGAYYAIDITDPTTPTVKWKVDSTTSGFSQLGQTWSQPQFGRVKNGDSRDVVAFVGAGYDNVEDVRDSNTQSFPDGNSVNRGKGVYAIKVAEYVVGGTNATLSMSGSSYKTISVSGMDFPVASDILVYDRNRNGIADRLYFGDTGGNLWRVDLTSNRDGTTATDWTAKKIFSSGGGRKIFFRPDAIEIDRKNVMVYFGTGDRAHPLSSNSVVDRFYAIRDNDFNSYSAPLEEDDLHDVTENVLQQEVEDQAIALESAAIRNAYGWYIRLDQNMGEQVTAPASVAAGVAYFTTFQPDPVAENDDPCAAVDGNMGIARMYAVNARTGEAVFNYYGANDSDEIANKRALRHDEAGEVAYVLQRNDRQMTVGIGIPSGVVFVIREDGIFGVRVSDSESCDPFTGVGCGPKIDGEQIWENLNLVENLYWIQW